MGILQILLRIQEKNTRGQCIKLTSKEGGKLTIIR